MRVGSITRLLVIPFALLGASAAPATNETDKIQGGWSADYLPAVANLALLLRDRSLAEFCTATLISPSWLLTARHCMRQMDGLYVFATIGRPNLADTSRGEQIPCVVGYEAPDGSDLLLIGLQRPASIGPMGKAADVGGLYAGQKVTAAGFGPQGRRRELQVADPVPAGGTMTLQVTELQLILRETCQSEYNVAIPPSMICAHDPTAKAAMCHGDSGGPLIVNGNVAGVLTAGSDGGTCPHGLPFFFTLVGSSAGWIDSMTSRAPSRDLVTNMTGVHFYSTDPTDLPEHRSLRGQVAV